MAERTYTRMIILGVLTLAASATAADSDPKTDQFGDSLPPGAVSRLGTIRYRYYNELKDVTYSADGESVIAFSSDVVLVWDADTGRLSRKLPIEQHYVQHVAYSKDRSRAVTAGHHVDEANRQSLYTLKIWDLAQPRELRTISLEPDARATSVAIDADGKMVAIGGNRGSSRVFEVASGAELLSYAVSEEEITAIAFSPDGQQLLFTNYSRPVSVWNWSAGDEPRQLNASMTDTVAIAWSPDEALVAVTYRDAEGVHLIDVKSGEPTGKLGEGSNFQSVYRFTFSPDGKHLAAYDTEHQGISLWNVETREMVRQIGSPPVVASGMTFSPDGERLATFSRHPGTVRVWDVASGEPVGGGDAVHEAAVSSIAFLPDDQQLATAGDDGTLRIWDVDSGRPHRILSRREERDSLERLTFWIRAMDVSPDGRLAATSSLDNTVRIWDVATGEEMFRLPGHGRLGGNRALRFSPDGGRLASWGDDMFLRVWDMQTGKALAEHSLRPSGVEIPEGDERRPGYGMDWRMMLGHGVFSRDLTRFALGFEPHDYYLFDVESGKEISRITLSETRIRSAAFAPDRDLMVLGGFGLQRQIPLATGGAFSRPENEFEVSLRRLPGGEPIHRWKLEGQLAGPVAFSPRGDVFAVATWAADAPIRVYATDGAKLLAEIEGFDAIPYSLAFSHDGRLLASGFSDTSALVWDWRQFEK